MFKTPTKYNIFGEAVEWTDAKLEFPKQGGGVITVYADAGGIVISGHNTAGVEQVISWKWVCAQMWEHYEPDGPGHCPLCGGY